jgi:hypothetical protein
VAATLPGFPVARRLRTFRLPFLRATALRFSDFLIRFRWASLGDARRGLDQPMPSSAGAVEPARRSGVTERLGERAKEQPRAGRPGWAFTQCAEITGDFQVAA